MTIEHAAIATRDPSAAKRVLSAGEPARIVDRDAASPTQVRGTLDGDRNVGRCSGVDAVLGRRDCRPSCATRILPLRRTSRPPFRQDATMRSGSTRTPLTATLVYQSPDVRRSQSASPAGMMPRRSPSQPARCRSVTIDQSVPAAPPAELGCLLEDGTVARRAEARLQPSSAARASAALPGRPATSARSSKATTARRARRRRLVDRRARALQAPARSGPARPC